MTAVLVYVGLALLLVLLLAAVPHRHRHYFRHEHHPSGIVVRTCACGATLDDDGRLIRPGR